MQLHAGRFRGDPWSEVLPASDAHPSHENSTLGPLETFCAPTTAMSAWQDRVFKPSSAPAVRCKISVCGFDQTIIDVGFKHPCSFVAAEVGDMVCSGTWDWQIHPGQLPRILETAFSKYAMYMGTARAAQGVPVSQLWGDGFLPAVNAAHYAGYSGSREEDTVLPMPDEATPEAAMLGWPDVVSKLCNKLASQCCNQMALVLTHRWHSFAVVSDKHSSGRQHILLVDSLGKTLEKDSDQAYALWFEDSQGDTAVEKLVRFLTYR